MQEIPLVAEPNQELSVRFDDQRFTLRIKEAGGVMVADIALNDVAIVSGTRILAGEPIIPYGYLEAGNFLLLTNGDALPTWGEFGATQSLVYLSADDIAAL